MAKNHSEWPSLVIINLHPPLTIIVFWGFLEWGVSPVIILFHGIFSIDKPTILGYPHCCGNLHISTLELHRAANLDSTRNSLILRRRRWNFLEATVLLKLLNADELEPRALCMLKEQGTKKSLLSHYHEYIEMDGHFIFRIPKIKIPEFVVSLGATNLASRLGIPGIPDVMPQSELL